jgi:cell shape-determining protein MreC
MESLLDLPPLPAVNYVSARVIRRDLDTWWHHITIQRGADARIQPGDAVVYRGVWWGGSRRCMPSPRLWN